jgi:hypothetical protein
MPITVRWLDYRSAKGYQNHADDVQHGRMVYEAEMKKSILILIILVLLSGCSGFQQFSDAIDDRFLVAQSIQCWQSGELIIDAIGYFAEYKFGDPFRPEAFATDGGGRHRYLLWYDGNDKKHTVEITENVTCSVYEVDK